MKFLPPLFHQAIAALGHGQGFHEVASTEHAVVVAALAATSLEAPLLVVTPTPIHGDRISALLRFLVANGPTPYAFPRWPRGADSPYEDVVEGPFLAATRMGALASFCLSGSPFAVVMDAALAARRTLPFQAFLDGVLRLEVGREIDRDELVSLLIAGGYRRMSSVAEVGEFAVRGGVVDLFPPMGEEPVRLELDGDTMESLKAFDPATQRAQRPLSHAWVVPAWEVPVDSTRLREGILGLRDASSVRGVATRDVALVEALLAEGRLPAGFPAMLPLIYGELDLPLAFLGDDAVVVVVDPAACVAAASAALDTLRADHEALRDSRRLCAGPEALAADGEALLRALEGRPRTMFLETGAASGLLGPEHSSARSADLVRATTPDVPVSQRVAGLVQVARDLVDGGQRLLVLAPSQSEARRVRDILVAEGLEPATAALDGAAEILASHPGDGGVRLGVGRLRTPFGFENLGLLVVPSEAVFGVKDALAGRRSEPRGFRPLVEFRDLAPGDLVIHREHGIGAFEGLKEVSADGRLMECLILHYKGGDRLYVPVDRASVLERYVGPSEGASRELDRLGGQSWVRRKKSARRAAAEIAGKLKEIYARRLATSAEPFSLPDTEFREFEATFPYETTADQERAIVEVLDDLCRDRPMDRLVCGDVGFGKTEVAVRAAFKAVLDGKQVAVLVPTTILAEQHRLTFAARFRNTPVVVESLSRFRSPAEIRGILERLKTGGIDVVVGTHRLLSKDLVFRDLGLLVVDEEHRFGVSHKERLREISATVHTLTLTATPIPRTLHMALSGIRELSVIATPPRDRLSVKTFVARFGRELVRSSILREIRRDGQVFVVHNRVEDIYEFAQRIQELVPEARVTVAHGQMSAPDLESVMSAFVRGDKDVLVATTIIESGLDIGSANTMLIHNADTLGLAQLYQLRGRVGRSAEQAYCYLLVRDPNTLTEDARRRIEAIERFSELSSGFHLASMDLEIRGAGDVLGAEQSGHMAAVGYDLFMEMLQDAVQALSGEEAIERIDPELKLDVEARIPSEFIPDEALRLRFYRRLASARNVGEVTTLASELADRFGRPPAALERLLVVMRIKARARTVGLAQVGLNGGVAQFVPAGGHDAAIRALVTAIASLGWRLQGNVEAGRVRVLLPKPLDHQEQLLRVDDLLRLAEGVLTAPGIQAAVD